MLSRFEVTYIFRPDRQGASRTGNNVASRKRDGGFLFKKKTQFRATCTIQKFLTKNNDCPTDSKLDLLILLLTIMLSIKFAQPNASRSKFSTQPCEKPRQTLISRMLAFAVCVVRLGYFV